MASALFTLADGAGSAVAVGGTSQPVGLNITAGNTVNGVVTDMSGVTGYTARTIWNNLGLSDAAFSAANFTINQSNGQWSFPAGSVDGSAYIVEVTILSFTTVPTVTRAIAGVYVSAKGSYGVLFPSTAQTQAQLVAMLSQPAGQLPATNAGWITNGATTNGQGSGGPTIVALVQLVCKSSGIFDYMVSASQNAAAATEVVTWTLTSQTGTAAVVLTGDGVAPGSGGVAQGIGSHVATAAAGTGIVISTGGGSEITWNSSAFTVGTAAVGSAFASVGTLHNSVSATAITPFTRGSNVFLVLKVTNSASNRVVNNINMSLHERLFA